MIRARRDDVECFQSTRDYRCKACHAWIRPSHWAAAVEGVSPKTGKRITLRYCESCAVSQGLAEAYESRPSLRVCDLVPGARIVTPLGPRTIMQRLSDSRDGRPRFAVGNRGQYVGIYKFDSEQARVYVP